MYVCPSLLETSMDLFSFPGMDLRVESSYEKTNNLDILPDLTPTRLYSHRRYLEIFVLNKMVKTIALISCAVTANLHLCKLHMQKSCCFFHGPVLNLDFLHN